MNDINVAHESASKFQVIQDLSAFQPVVASNFFNRG